MKWVLLLAALASVLPLSIWLRQNPREAPKLWVLVGFLVVEHGPLHLYMALDSWAGQWPGYTLGAEISLLELTLLAIYLTLPRSRYSLPFLFSIGFYFFAAFEISFWSGFCAKLRAERNNNRAIIEACFINIS